MAVYFTTDSPNKLLSAFKKAIDDGKVVTWSYDEEDDFTHTAPQWNELAWLSPTIGDGRLEFYIFPPEDKTISKEVYAIFHGRFIESFLAHCDKLFEYAYASALPEGDDKIE
jgi:hypothetical protein